MIEDDLINDIIRNVKKLTDNRLMELSGLLETWLTENNRQYERKTINIPIDFTKEKQLFKVSSKDLSCGGIFVNTKAKNLFELNQKITLVFKLSSEGRSYKMKGRVVRQESDGIGVQFDDVTPYTLEFLMEELYKE